MITQDSVKAWLKEQHRTREWLAEKCDAEVGTVNNWLSTTRGIPSKAIPIIAQLMQADKERKSAIEHMPSYLTLRFSREDFGLIQDAARATGDRIEDWAERELLALAEASLDELTPRLKVAEDPADYPANPIKSDAPKWPRPDAL